MYGIIMLVHAMAQERLVGPRENKTPVRDKQHYNTPKVFNPIIGIRNNKIQTHV